ncbi:MAG: dihydroneopterin aldolase, partial [Cyclobacteriaceae bacterium]|nr:dihydroneopterin aldolase [Cyclobacteriaceae bacterium]
MTGKISLEGLEFHAYHGVYPHERSSGNKFEVDVLVETNIDPSAFQDDLSGTLNYESLYEVIREEMEKPSKLLERVGQSMATAILDKFPQALSVTITIAKFNPPIGGVCR